MIVRRKEYFACSWSNTSEANDQYEKADQRFLELLLADNVDDVRLRYQVGRGFIIEYLHDFPGEEDL